MRVRRELHIDRRVLGWFLVPIFLCLVAMGARVPGTSHRHSPKPRPRAIIESSFKNSEDATVKSVLTAELCESIALPRPPAAYRTSFQEKTFRFCSITSPEKDARAPPPRPC
ncbi:MAG TPA: hypothetical protein VJ550_16005 [Geomonas sp.]|nr:hypothetical protein [Geomonas sp.]